MLSTPSIQSSVPLQSDISIHQCIEITLEKVASDFLISIGYMLSLVLLPVSLQPLKLQKSSRGTASANEEDMWPSSIHSNMVNFTLHPELLSALLQSQTFHYWYTTRFFPWLSSLSISHGHILWEISSNYPYQCLRNMQQGPLSPESKSSKSKYLQGEPFGDDSQTQQRQNLNPKVNRDKKESFLQNLLLYPTVPILVHSICPWSCLPFSASTDQHQSSKSLYVQEETCTWVAVIPQARVISHVDCIMKPFLATLPTN